MLAIGQLKETRGYCWWRWATFLNSFEHLSWKCQDERALLLLLLDVYALSFPFFYFHMKEVFIVENIDNLKFTI